MSAIPPPAPPRPANRPSRRRGVTLLLVTFAFAAALIVGLTAGDFLIDHPETRLPAGSPLTERPLAVGSANPAGDPGALQPTGSEVPLEREPDPAREAAHDQLVEAAGGGGADGLEPIDAFLADPPVLIADAGALPDFFDGGIARFDPRLIGELLPDLILEPIARGFRDVCADVPEANCPPGVGAIILGELMPPPFEITDIYTTTQAWTLFDCAPIVPPFDDVYSFVVVANHPASFEIRHGGGTVNVEPPAEGSAKVMAWTDALEQGETPAVGHCIALRQVPRPSYDYSIGVVAESAITGGVDLAAITVDTPPVQRRPPVEVSLVTDGIPTPDTMVVAFTVPFRSTGDPQEVLVDFVDPAAGEDCTMSPALETGGYPTLGPIPYDPSWYDPRYDAARFNILPLGQGADRWMCVWWLKGGEVEERESRLISMPDLRRWRLTLDAVSLNAFSLGLDFTVDVNWNNRDCVKTISGVATPSRTTVRQSLGLSLCDNGAGLVPELTRVRVTHRACLEAGGPRSACVTLSPPIPTPTGDCLPDCRIAATGSVEFPIATALYDPETIQVVGVSMTGEGDWEEYWETILPGVQGDLDEYEAPVAGECVAHAASGSCLDMMDRPWPVGTIKITWEAYDDPGRGDEAGFYVGPPVDFAAAVLNLSASGVELVQPVDVASPTIRVSVAADRPVTATVRVIADDLDACGPFVPVTAPSLADSHTITVEGLCPGMLFHVAVDLTDERGILTTYAPRARDFSLDAAPGFAFLWPAGEVSTPPLP